MAAWSPYPSAGFSSGADAADRNGGVSSERKDLDKVWSANIFVLGAAVCRAGNSGNRQQRCNAESRLIRGDNRRGVFAPPQQIVEAVQTDLRTMPVIEQIVFKRSHWKIVLLLIVSLTFVAAGAFLVARSPDKWVGWMSITFFGGCAAVFVWQLLDSRPRLIIDDRGIFDRTLGVGVIPWSEIVDAFPRTIASCRFVCLVLRQPEEYLSRLPRRRRPFASLNRELGFTDFSINLIDIGVDPAELCELIMKRASLEREHNS